MYELRTVATRLMVLAACWISTFAPALAQDATAPTARPASARPADAPTNVLFMCPHGAAKSVLASAYFARLARERGLNVRVETAGTYPDAAVAPAVAAHLTKAGYDVPIAKPRAVTAKDVETADLVISLGCDLTGLPAPRGEVRRWDDVPGPGENLAGADEAIRQKVIALVDELSKRPDVSRRPQAPKP